MKEGKAIIWCKKSKKLPPAIEPLGLETPEGHVIHHIGEYERRRLLCLGEHEGDHIFEIDGKEIRFSS